MRNQGASIKICNLLSVRAAESGARTSVTVRMAHIHQTKTMLNKTYFNHLFKFLFAVNQFRIIIIQLTGKREKIAECLIFHLLLPPSPPAFRL